jgi:hypothetical protein
MASQSHHVSDLLKATDYPHEAHLRVYQRWADGRPVLSEEDALRGRQTGWSEWIEAWNGVAYRYVSFDEYGKELDAKLPGTGFVDSRYEQERCLFGFFVTGLSVLECTCYTAYAIGAAIAPDFFPFESQQSMQAVSISSTVGRYKRSPFKETGLHKALAQLNKDRALTDWRRRRNFIAHRAAPPRVVILGQSRPDLWMGQELTPDTVESNRTWLVAHAHTLAEAIEEFTTDHVPVRTYE